MATTTHFAEATTYEQRDLSGRRRFVFRQFLIGVPAIAGAAIAVGGKVTNECFVRKSNFSVGSS